MPDISIDDLLAHPHWQLRLSPEEMAALGDGPDIEVDTEVALVEAEHRRRYDADESEFWGDPPCARTWPR